MKKILALPLLVVFCSGLFAQSGDIKNLRFGGTILPSLYWYSPDDVKKFEGDGANVHFGVLINAEYSFSQNFAIGFGIGLSGGGGSIKFSDTAHYYFNDDAIIKLGDTNGLKAKYDHYKLNSRTYKATYYVLPISLKMRTNEIGHMRYFFQPGVNIGIRQKVRADDNLSTLSKKVPGNGQLSSPGFGQTASQTDLDISDDMALFTFSAVISAGAEYYLSGSTAVVFSLGYDYGLSNAVSGTSDYLFRTPYKSGGSDMHEIEQKFYQNGLILSIGILF